MGADGAYGYAAGRGGLQRGSCGIRQAFIVTVLATAVAGWASSALLSPVHAADGRSALHLAQGSGSEALQLSVAPTTIAKAASQASLAISVGPAGAVPKNSFVRVRGLPPTVSLSEGYVTAPGAWSVPIYALSSLHLNVPVGLTGRSELGISLVTEDGALLAQAKTVLIIEPPALPAPKEATRPPSPPPASPAAPPAPVLSPADREAAERFVSRGEREAEQGNIAAARQFYLRAAQIGLARGAMLLAATYDPRELARLGVQGLLPNVGEARKWYERARELGAPEAEERLARLVGG